ncbi:hypothetical protein ScPMuIL_018813 [Solemya velum]
MLELSQLLMSEKSMYRRHIMQQQEQETNAQFIGRLGSLPVVNSAWTQALVLYQRTKDSNVLLKTTLGMAENTVRVVSSTTKPIVDRYQPQIFDRMDAYACQALTRLEENYPVITKKPDELLQDGKQLVKPAVDRVTSVYQFGAGTYNMGKEKVDQVKKIGTDTVVGIKDFSVTQMKKGMDTSYGKMVVGKLEDVLTMSEGYVDVYLPPSEGEDLLKEKEGKEEKGEKKDPLTRVTTLSNKVRQRMYRKAMKDLTNVKVRSQDALSKLHSTVDLISYAKSHLDTARETVGVNVGAAQDKLLWAWGEINSEKEKEETPNTLEGHTIALARRLTKQVRHGLTVISTHIPETVQVANLQERIAEARKYSEELYTSFKEVKTYEEIPIWALTQARGKMQYMQETLSFLTDMVLSVPLNWLVPSHKASEPTAELGTEMLKLEPTEEDSKKKVKKN